MAVSQFQTYLNENGLSDITVEITDEPTRTAQEAAKVHNVPVCNIVKSLLAKCDSGFVLFLVPGDKRLDLEWAKSEFGFKDVRMANPDEVKEITGYSIGGVPPFGHLVELKTVIVDGFDESSELVAAAGAGNAVFRVRLVRLRGVVSMQ